MLFGPSTTLGSLAVDGSCELSDDVTVVGMATDVMVGTATVAEVGNDADRFE